MKKLLIAAAFLFLFVPGIGRAEHYVPTPQQLHPVPKDTAPNYEGSVEFGQQPVASSTPVSPGQSNQVLPQPGNSVGAGPQSIQNKPNINVTYPPNNFGSNSGSWISSAPAQAVFWVIVFGLIAGIGWWFLRKDLS